MIRFKVVTLDRKSSTYDRGDYDFVLDYPKDTTVTAPKWSIGIMVFDTKTQAKEYISLFNDYIAKDLRIIKVQTIGRGRRPLKILNLNLINNHNIFDTLRGQSEFYKDIMFSGEVTTNCTYNTFWPVPDGTMCYLSVKVLS